MYYENITLKMWLQGLAIFSVFYWILAMAIIIGE